MDIKEFLLEGGAVYHPYKKLAKEWVGEAKLHIFAGYYSKPKIILESPYERKEYRLDQIDEAIRYFQSIVFNPVNLQYKMNETIRELAEKGEDVDLDDEEVFKRVDALRKSKILKAVRHVKSNS